MSHGACGAGGGDTYSRLGARAGGVVYNTGPQVAAPARQDPAVLAAYATVNRRRADSSSNA